MSNVPNPIITIGISGFLTDCLGILTGILFSFFIKHRGRRFKGTILGFIGGLMLAIVTFDLLPESYDQGSIYIAASNSQNHRFLKAAIFMAIGIGIHNIPSGIALGSLLSTSATKAFHLTAVLIIHGIPEGLAVGIFLRESNASLFTLIFIFISILTSLPMGFGSLLGGIIGKVSPAVISVSLAFAGGMILYIICRETLPNARDTWRGRMSTIGNVSGIIVGMLFVPLLH